MNRIRTEEILHESQLDEEANTNPRTRTLGMKWVKLGEGKDPEFLEVLFLYRGLNVLDTDCDDFAVGYLKSIEVESDKKVYRFIIESDVFDTFTHYCIPTVPK